MAELTDDPKHWRQRAEEIRTLAEKAHDEQLRLRLLDVADGYDLLAQRAERLKGDQKP